jgi:hypothetical protein
MRTELTDTIRKPEYMLPSEAIAKYGWTQGQYGDKCRGLCAMGAIYLSYEGKDMTERDPEWIRPDGQFDDIINLTSTIASHVEFVYPSADTLVSWNDAEDRTVEEVITLMEKAEKELGWRS